MKYKHAGKLWSGICVRKLPRVQRCFISSPYWRCTGTVGA